MVFPHTHKKKMQGRLELILEARKNDVLHECFLYAAKTICNMHSPTSNSQRSTNQLLRQAIIEYYNNLPENKKATNEKTLQFKKHVLKIDISSVHDCCALAKPGIDKKAEERIYYLTLDCVKQMQANANQNKQKWSKKRRRKK